MKSKQFARTGLIAEVVAALCQMTAEPFPEDYSEDDDTDEKPAARLASQVQVQQKISLAGYCTKLCRWACYCDIFAAYLKKG